MSLYSQFSKDIIYAVRAGQPIETHGLTLYPITMSDYDEFAVCKDALAILQASLPAAYLGMDYLSALFALALADVQKKEENKDENKETAAAFQRVMRLLYLALRSKTEEIEQISRDILYKRTEHGLCISHIVIHQNGNDVNITPSVFSSQLRPLIAFQNAIELPNEYANPEILKAQKKFNSSGETAKLDANIDDLIASVAFQSRVPTREILSWTVREFEYRRRAIERDKRYMICGQAELSGFVSFKDGNPNQSWCFDTEKDSLNATSLSDLGKQLGQV